MKYFIYLCFSHYIEHIPHHTMYRSHTCGELRLNDKGKNVTLCGWVQNVRNLGGLTFVDLRDRYGITQITFNLDTNKNLCESARKLGREFVIQAKGKVVERTSKNKNIPTGDIEIICEEFSILNASKLPPFLIENETDALEELRMKYRYLDIRRPVIKDNLIFRHRFTQEVRKYLSEQGFIEIETPALIKTTPEGARDYVVPSRIHPGEFYALPQSPQTFKQLLMAAGMDKYFQIVRCFRDEDLRADRQPEFTQIDCEMSFVTQDDVLNTFEGMAKHLLKSLKGSEHGNFPRMAYEDAMKNYGTDKPDIRFEMKFTEITDLAKGKGFKIFDEAEIVVGICVNGCAEYSRKQLDELTEFVRQPSRQGGRAAGLIYVKFNSDETLKSSVDKFYNGNDLKKWAEKFGAKAGDLLLILAGEKDKTRKQLSELRLKLGRNLKLIRQPTDKFQYLWITDFPLLEWNEETKKWDAVHHPFTSPKEKDVKFLETEPGKVRANAYDLVLNGTELGSGSIRIHQRELQQRMFNALGLSEQEAQQKFGFLMNAFEYGAPPHGGVAFGMDRWIAILAGTDYIRDVIAFPKNNAGRDVMIDAPSPISKQQLDELKISFKP